MKRTVIFLLICFISINLYAQDQRRFEYCEIVGKVNWGYTSISSAHVIYNNGNRTKKLMDKKGKVIEFDTMLDALNYMGERGWEFIQAYPGEYNSTLNNRYILKKEISVKNKRQY